MTALSQLSSFLPNPHQIRLRRELSERRAASAARIFTGDGLSEHAHHLYCFTGSSGGRFTRAVAIDLSPVAIGSVRAQFAACISSYADQRRGAAILSELNDLARALGGKPAGTAAVVTYDRARGTMACCSAGHPPVLMRRSNNPWWPMRFHARGRRANLPLGLNASCEYDEITVRVEPGDRAALYTAEMSELRNSSGEPFGVHRILSLLRATSGLPADSVPGALSDALHNHAPTANVDAKSFLILETVALV